MRGLSLGPTLAAALALAAATASPAQSFRQKDFDAYVARGLRTLDTPGAAVAVVKNGRVLFAKGYGVRRVGEQAPVDAHTLFQIASNTKAFTTGALAILADEGKVSWDDPVTKFLPGFQLSDPYVTRELTVRDLVTHRSGLGLGAGDLLWFHSTYSRAEIAHRIRFAKPASSFRSQYAYDNVLYIVAGEIVPVVAGASWDDFIARRIFAPLGMTESGTTTAFFMGSANAAAPHAFEDGRLQVVPVDSVENIAPAGGISSSVSDLAKWLICRLDSGRYAGEGSAGGGGARLFSEAQAREMWSGQTILPITDPPPPLAALRPSFSEYGLGWRLRDYVGRKIVSHTGGLAGMSSQITLVPAEKLGIVILTNSEADLMAALSYRLLDDLLGAPPRSRTDWVAAFAEAERLARARADSTLSASRAARDSSSGPSLSLDGYAGRYHDDLYGDAVLALEGGKLVLRLTRSPAFVGDLQHWQHDTFIAHWRTKHLEDAYVTFALDPKGAIDRFQMAAVSPLADFSFDYQDLLFRPVAAQPGTGR
ncbi:MAG TPA: serine hydrolase [Gemmatimonadales bacterium]|nr:serine hydrolase [Gemmatimonadales bacterium]